MQQVKEHLDSLHINCRLLQTMIEIGARALGFAPLIGFSFQIQIAHIKVGILSQIIQIQLTFPISR